MYQISQVFRDAIKAAGGPDSWARAHQCKSRSIRGYYLGSRRCFRGTLHELYDDDISYWNLLGVHSWRDLAA